MLLYYPCVLSHVAVSCPMLLYYPCVLSHVAVSCHMLLYYPCVLSHVAVSCPILLYYPCVLSHVAVSCHMLLYCPSILSHVAVLQANGHRRRREQTTLGSNPETGLKLQLQNSTEPNKNNQNHKAPPHPTHLKKEK